jgi:hypothetical protein
MSVEVRAMPWDYSVGWFRRCSLIAAVWSTPIEGDMIAGGSDRLRKNCESCRRKLSWKTLYGIRIYEFLSALARPSVEA